jgi:hypothetical protein
MKATKFTFFCRVTALCPSAALMLAGRGLKLL